LSGVWMIALIGVVEEAGSDVGPSCSSASRMAETSWA
jgi:hypothetical protein